ncbi:MAG: inorganic phosphate transporter [Candidatus Wallbacteria bacterium]|nr:inorganic phosphate transporter [Candidatus Wallbacteria bacterium]
MSDWIAAGAALLVSAANGANDNSKGVATLAGSGAASQRTALAWGTLATLGGSLCAVALSAELARSFSGAGLVPDGLVGQQAFVAAVALGAAGTVILATCLAMPISTTHALTGALVGAGLALGGELRLSTLGAKFVAPLLLSPAVALVLTMLLYPVLRRLRLQLGVTASDCVCVEGRWVPLVPQGAPGGGQAMPLASALPVLTTCQRRYAGTLLSVEAQDALDWVHFVSAGATSFARGLNDTPKIAALLLAAGTVSHVSGFAAIAVSMAIGGLLYAGRVSRTMSERITRMNHGQGFTANLVTAALVLFASRLGLPVSTTHVSCGSLFGLGATTGEARWRMIASIALAWIFTLPLAVTLSALAAACLAG